MWVRVDEQHHLKFAADRNPPSSIMTGGIGWDMTSPGDTRDTYAVIIAAGLGGLVLVGSQFWADRGRAVGQLLGV